MVNQISIDQETPVVFNKTKVAFFWHPESGIWHPASGIDLRFFFAYHNSGGTGRNFAAEVLKGMSAPK
jgi:hypothetical protein